jgi:hypothetical protein
MQFFQQAPGQQGIPAFAFRPVQPFQPNKPQMIPVGPQQIIFARPPMEAGRQPGPVMIAAPNHQAPNGPISFQGNPFNQLSFQQVNQFGGPMRGILPPQFQNYQSQAIPQQQGMPQFRSLNLATQPQQVQFVPLNKQA